MCVCVCEFVTDYIPSNEPIVLINLATLTGTHSMCMHDSAKIPAKTIKITQDVYNMPQQYLIK